MTPAERLADTQPAPPPAEDDARDVELTADETARWNADSETIARRLAWLERRPVLVWGPLGELVFGAEAGRR